MTTTTQPTQSIPTSKPNTPQAVEQWLNPIKWQLFGTLTFPFSPSTETAARKLGELVNILEKGIRTRIGYVAGTESKTKFGAPVARHIHLALAAARPIPHQMVEDIWNQAVGRRTKANESDEKMKAKESDLAAVVPFESGRGGISYIVKNIADPDCSVDYRNLSYFAAIPSAAAQDRKARRLARRFQAQASTAPDTYKPKASTKSSQPDAGALRAFPAREFPANAWIAAPKAA